MPVTQMNIRMDAALKENGDMVFSQAGYTPTHAVRLLWEFAQRNAGKPEHVRELLDQLRGTDEGKPRDNARKLAQHACRQRAKLYTDHGIPVPASFSTKNENDLPAALQEQLEQDRLITNEAYAERSKARGF